MIDPSQHVTQEFATSRDGTRIGCLRQGGRGPSPQPYDDSHDITRDVEDLDTILTANGAHYVFGLSSGAVITLEAASRTGARSCRAPHRRTCQHRPDTLRAMLPGIRYDFNAVGGMGGKITTFGSLDKPVPLLTGTKSGTSLRQAIQRLRRLLPQAERVDLDGLGHSGPWNQQRGGSPQLVARALETFFTAPEPTADQRRT